MKAVEQLTSAQAVSRLLSLIPPQKIKLDTTFGNGKFWEGDSSVLGMDIDSTRAKDVVGSFLALPFKDASVDLVLFDPPFHTTGSKSIEETRFKSMGQNEKELKVLFQNGTRECWRITKNFLLVKCQGYIHNHRPQWMPLWAISVCGEPYEWLIGTRPSKITSGRWKTVRSLRRQHSDYLLFCKQGNHR